MGWFGNTKQNFQGTEIRAQPAWCIQALQNKWAQTEAYDERHMINRFLTTLTNSRCM